MEAGLVQKAKSGDKEAVAHLVHVDLKRVYRASYFFLRNREDASDVCQEVFLKVYKSISRIDATRAFYPYVYTVIKNTCINRLKRRRSVAAQSYEVDTIVGNYPSPEEDLVMKEDRAQLFRAIEKLPDKHREILLLKHWGDCSYEEISEILCILDFNHI